MRFRWRRSWQLAWNFVLSSRVALTPRRGTHGDESRMKYRMSDSTGGLFTEVRGRVILRTSHSPGPNTYECPGRISAAEGYYPDFLIIPFRERCPWVGFRTLSDRGYVGVLV